MKKLYDFFHKIEKLKDTYRFSTIPTLRDRESSADHSWRLAVMTFMMADELKLDIDVTHALKIALVHDLPETVNGDIDAKLVYDGTVSKEQKNMDETAGMKKLVSGLPEKKGNELYDLWEEYEYDKTEEAKYVKALDKIEGMMQLVEGDGLRHDVPDLMGHYGNDSVKKFPALIPLFRIFKEELKKECLKAGIEWKEE